MEEIPSWRSLATNATNCQECGLSELRRSRYLVMLAICDSFGLSAPQIDN